MDSLLRRTALPVDRDAWNVLRIPGSEPAGAGDVTCLGCNRVDATKDYVFDEAGIDAGALDETFDGVRA
jgi:hypothetical protein